MRITIESYRLLIFIGFASFLATIAGFFLGPLLFNENLLSLPLIAGGFYGAFVVLTNLKKGGIEAYWKKENKILTIPFKNESPLRAYDDEGTQYQIGVLLRPKRIA